MKGNRLSVRIVPHLLLIGVALTIFTSLSLTIRQSAVDLTISIASTVHAQEPLPAGSTQTDQQGNLSGSGEEEPVAGTTCIETFGGFLPIGFNWAVCAAGMGDFVLRIVGFFLGLAGLFLDAVVQFTVVEMSTNVENIGVVAAGWAGFRDLANIFLIFLLLAIGIATILQISDYGWKRLLVNVILVALLINFSLFFTKVIIDVGNLFAIQFYKSASAGTTISQQYMQALSLTTIYQVYKINPATGEVGGTTGIEIAATQLDFGRIALITFLGSILLLVATFVFLAVAILLIVRFAALVFLMVLAPLAFVGMVIPQTKGLANRWWKTLINYTIFAPAFFALTSFVVQVIGNPVFRQSIGIAPNPTVLSGESGIAWSAILVNFAVVITFVVMSLILAKEFGVYGARTAIAWGNSARRWGQSAVARYPALAGGWASSKALQFYNRKQTELQTAQGGAGKIGRIARGGLGLVTLGALSDRSIRGVLTRGSQMRLGGPESFVERQQAARTRQVELQRIGKQTTVEDQVNEIIKDAGINITRAEAAQRISALTAKQAEEMKPEILANQFVAPHITPDILEALAKSEKVAQRELDTIVTAHFKPLQDALNRGVRSEIRKELRGYSNKEIEMLGHLLRSEQVAVNLSQSQLDAIQKSNKVNAELKREVKHLRTDYFNRALGAGTIGAEFQGMSPAAIAKLDESILIDRRAVQHFTIGIANEVIKEVSVGTRRAIRREIDNIVEAGGAPSKLQQLRDEINRSGSALNTLF